MRWLYLLLLCFLLSVCNLSENDANKQIAYLQMSELANADDISNENDYYISDEMQLVKTMIMRYEQGYDTITFHGMQIEHLETICDYLTYLVPFDVKLQMQTISAEDPMEDRYMLTLINMDNHYEQAKAFAKETIHDIINESMSIAEKAKAIHNYLIDHIVYDHKQLLQKDSASNVFSAYGALLEQKAVCSGYARAFLLYARLADIPCLLVSADTIDHAWNMVYDGVKWIYVDATWDDIEQEERLDLYLNKTSDEFFKDGRHVMDQNKPESFYRRLGNAFFRN